MNQLTVPNANQLTDKKFLASYIHDAAEIASAIYALEQLERKIQKSINKCRETIEEYRHTKKEYTALSKQVENMEAEYRILDDKQRVAMDKYRKYDKFSTKLPYIIGALLFPFLPINIYIAVSLFDSNKKDAAEKFSSLFEQFDEHERQLEDKQTLLKIAKENLEQLPYKDAEKQLPVLTERLQYVQAQRKELEQKATAFYQLGVIPPDYRHPDCIMMLDRFFKNDLVNTMQEAVRYYDHKVEIGEIMKGFDNILRSLDNLNGTMQSVAQRLRQIDDTVYAMHQELADKLDKQFDETQAARYATEHLEKTNEKILFYQEQDYVKNL